MEVSLLELKELLLCGRTSPASSNSDDSHYEIGRPYMFHTVTAFYKGTLEKVTPSEVVLTGACWVADTGRFNESVEDDSKHTEVEPFGERQKLIISRSALVCAYQIPSITRKLK